ncbi:SOS response-associated peptidase [Frigoriglobus tundricola]|uniref:Abasic site processing protein n=1 Tax=Frigoriglobus tundricola TaxID=2774151 RepID=A0A6M5Z4P6_9BACT|nr:SOS response-associated peptidase [Frigoriglobus tundricola]QJX00444.1 hypothetical protein FTUN_8074 [Frigoriglobus tundricola]
MPARIVITSPVAELIARFELPAARPTEDQPQARYNVAPTQTVPVIRVTNGARELAHLRWGLIPHWNSDPAHEGFVNARAETVALKPSFRDAYRARRCLVPANGFYGWKPGPRRKQPYYFRPVGGGLFACAGIWDRWVGPNGLVESVSVLTMPANELVAAMDPRMPVVVGANRFSDWLDPDEARAAGVLEPLEPYPAERMECWPVSTRVNSPAEDDAGLLVPISVPF